MTIEETEVNRVRFEDLSESLQNIINNLISYNDESYSTFRSNLASISNLIDTTSIVYSGDTNPPMISLGKTVYFDSKNACVKISDLNGGWTFLS